MPKVQIEFETGKQCEMFIEWFDGSGEQELSLWAEEADVEIGSVDGSRTYPLRCVDGIYNVYLYPTTLLFVPHMYQKTIEFIEDERIRLIGVGQKSFICSVSRTFLDKITSLNLTLSNHDFAFGDNRNSMYCWDNEQHHLEFELFTDESVEFFYKNRQTDKIYGEDFNLEDELSDEIMDYLSLFKINN